MHVQSRYPYEPSERTHCPSTKVSWLFDELSNNNASNDRLSLSVIPTPGNNAILVVYQINTRYNTYARDGAFAISIRLALCKVNTN